jgi:UDP-N-acetylglucosamine 2-epimerase
VYKTLFSGQHESLLGLSVYPDIRLEQVMEQGQSLNALVSKIINKMDAVFRENIDVTRVIVQGDTSTSFAIALAAFHHKLRIIHVEAGLRTHSKCSPFPEEMNRVLISRLADIHLCPTLRALKNLELEGITTHVYNVGNTVVDIFESVKKTTCTDFPLADRFHDKPYILVTLHRRENRGDRMNSLWAQLNSLSERHMFVYVTHPSLPQARES